jgi:hypothetical protein
MKIQYAIVKPELCAEPGITAIAGVVICRENFPDFSAHQLIIDPDPSEGMVRLFDSGETHHSRLDDDWEDHAPGGLDSLAFHEVLTKSVFQIPQLNIPAADVTLVETDLPGTPAGYRSYAMFGLIRGNDRDLSSISEKVFEADLHKDIPQPGNPKLGIAKDTGIEAKHVIGNHLLQILTQPIWGFADQKVGMSSLTTKSEFEKIRKNREHMLEHGKNMPGVRSYLDPSTVDFLRAMNANGTTSPSHWQTQNERTERAQTAKKAWKASLVQDNGPTP